MDQKLGPRIACIPGPQASLPCLLVIPGIYVVHFRPVEDFIANLIVSPTSARKFASSPPLSTKLLLMPAVV